MYKCLIEPLITKQLFRPLRLSYPTLITQVNRYSHPYFPCNVTKYGGLRSETARKRSVFTLNFRHERDDLVDKPTLEEAKNVLGYKRININQVSCHHLYFDIEKIN